MAEEKEELTQEVEETTSEIEETEEDVDDYFNPFTETTDEEVEEEEKEEEKEEKTEPVEDDVRQELAQVKAEREATREVNKFIKANPQYEDMADDLVDLASKALARGHTKPVEFAVRNIKSPDYWIEYGKKMAREDLVEVSKNRIGGSSLSRSEGSAPDFKNMSSSEFEEYYRSVVSGT